MNDQQDRRQDWFVRPVVVWEIIGHDHRRITERVDSKDEALRIASAAAGITGGDVLLLNEHGKVVSR